MNTRYAIVSLVAIGSVVASGCDDVTPLPYEAPVRDANLPDHVDLAQVTACRECATDLGATCRSALDSCQAADSRCGELLTCLTGSNCWRQLDIRNFTDPPPCAVDCLRRNHVTSINEIGGPATQFYVCIVDPARCATACFDQAPAVGRDQ